MVGIVFGLAMDYEVFLVSRIREGHVHGENAAESIVSGLRASSRVVVAAPRHRRFRGHRRTAARPPPEGALRVTIRVLLADDQALRAGAAGFLGKDVDADQFLDGIRTLAELTLR
jgi:hypothetical protein